MNGDSLLPILAGIPDLPGARCKGRSGLYERTVGEHRMAGRLTKTELENARREALQVCRNGCPALEPCRAWLDALPLSRRPAGVVAGVVITAGGVPSRTGAPATPTASGADS